MSAQKQGSRVCEEKKSTHSTTERKTFGMDAGRSQLAAADHHTSFHPCLHADAARLQRLRVKRLIMIPQAHVSTPTCSVEEQRKFKDEIRVLLELFHAGFDFRICSGILVASSTCA